MYFARGTPAPAAAASFRNARRFFFSCKLMRFPQSVRRGPGHDWCVVRLGAPGSIRRVEVDTAYFKGNVPESCSLEVCSASRNVTDSSALVGLAWKEILPRTKLKADSLHVYEKEIMDAGEVTHARFHIYPDGGIARLRIFGRLARKSS